MTKPLIAMLLCLGAFGFEQPRVYRPGPDVTAPIVVQKAPVVYTDEARLAKLEGSVMLSVVVGADGKPRDIEVARLLGLGLDDKAIENVGAWQFKPGVRAGNAVAVRVNVEVFFRPQRNLWDWHAVRAAFSGTSSTRPILLKTKFPPMVDDEENASVTMTFDIQPDGVPGHAVIVKSSDPKWENSVLDAVSTGWRFEPQPANVRAWIELVRGSHAPIPAPPLPPEFRVR